jgi:hypothetical protein
MPTKARLPRARLENNSADFPENADELNNSQNFVNHRFRPVPSSTARAVYSGQDRLGSYARFGDVWVAVDRLGKPVGRFPTELEAQNAISARGGR